MPFLKTVVYICFWHSVATIYKLMTALHLFAYILAFFNEFIERRNGLFSNIDQYQFTITLLQISIGMIAI